MRDSEAWMKIALYLGRYPWSPHLLDDWREGWREFGLRKSQWSRTYTLSFIVGDIEVAFNPSVERYKKHDKQ